MAKSILFQSASLQYASISDSGQTGLDLQTDFTFEGWFKFPTYPTGNACLLGKGKNSPAYYLHLIPTKRFIVQWQNTTVSAFQTDVLPDSLLGTWVHIAVVGDISVPSAQFYLNGRPVNTNTLANAETTIKNNANDFTIGALEDSGTPERYYNGQMYDLRVWNIKRTTVQIQDNYKDILTSHPTELVANYLFKDDLTDETTNANNLTAINSPTYSTDTPIPQSLSLASASLQQAFITDANQTGLDLTGDFTIEAWLKLATFPSQYIGIVSKFLGVGLQRSYIFGIDTNSMRFVFSQNGSAIGANTDGAIASGTWQHWAIIYKAGAGTVEYVLNGVSQAINGGIVNSIFNGSANFEISGYNGGASSHYDGLIFDPRVFNIARTPAQILADYQQLLDGDETGLVGNWQWRGNYADNTANINTLTPVNSPTFSSDVPYSPTNPPDTPSIIAPPDTSTDQDVNPTLTGSAFSDPDIGATHQASQWQIATEVGFTNIVWDSGIDTSNLVSTVVNTTNGAFAGALVGETHLAFVTQYFVRVRYQDENNEWSAYSTISSFTTTVASPISITSCNYLLHTHTCRLYRFKKTGNTEEYNVASYLIQVQFQIIPAGSDILAVFPSVPSYALHEMFTCDLTVIKNGDKIVDQNDDEYIVRGEPQRVITSKLKFQQLVGEKVVGD